MELTQKQVQKLTITSKLQQALKILQFSQIELIEYLQQELKENPLLEQKEKIEKKEETDFNWQESFNTSFLQREENKNNFLENIAVNKLSLQEHLLWQLKLVYDNIEYVIGENLIGNIDDNGYLQIDIKEVAKNLNVHLEQVNTILKTIQTFEPIGVGARNLKECLIIQLKYYKIENQLVYQLIDFLPELGEKQYLQLSKLLNVSIEEIQKAQNIISQLEPKPGQQYNTEECTYILPDAIIIEVDNEYKIIINENDIPRLKINSFYKNLLSQPFDFETKEYIKKKLNSAKDVIKHVKYRKETLYKIIDAIFKIQNDFLKNGQRGLKPLTLKKIAEKVNMHESTISRVTSSKYVQTPKGVFGLKYFFHRGFSQNEEKISDENIKNIMIELIENEDTKKPLSDQAIVDLFKQKGINIARRTITKYRKELNISSSNKRRKGEK